MQPLAWPQLNISLLLPAALIYLPQLFTWVQLDTY